MERDLVEEGHSKIFKISTHTLTWSVTPVFIDTEGSTKISTHTLTWSVTGVNYNFLAHKNFNSHAHVERDPVNLWVGVVNVNFNSHAHVERDWTVVRSRLSMMISTHTLTWSVTTSYKRSFLIYTFQLTRSRGA